MSQGKKLYLDLQPAILQENLINVNTLERGCPAGLTAFAIDCANLGASARDLGGRADYRTLIADLSLGMPWIGTAVILAVEMTDGLVRFADALRAVGLSTIISLREMVCGRSKAVDDVIVAAEAACMAMDERVENLVIASGDGALAHLVKIGHRAGKRVTVAAFAGTLSHRLEHAADEVVLLGARHVIPYRRAA